MKHIQHLKCQVHYLEYRNPQGYNKSQLVQSAYQFVLKEDALVCGDQLFEQLMNLSVHLRLVKHCGPPFQQKSKAFKLLMGIYF